ncbi:MAG: class III extradiol ring-cleavage dioxygenase [Novosphingobium sp.]|nr:class III extradiol ring-cleavage dioxygenase [Novosphingobium sp.]
MTETLTRTRQPALYIPHGGGPCFFMPDPHGLWTAMEAYLRSIPASLPERPRAILVVSAHWETHGFAFTGAEKPGPIYDYYGFPPHTYELTYPAPGAPWLAGQAAGLLRGAGLEAHVDPEHGLDHGVFVPLKVAFPDADIPVVEMSLDASLDPALHLAAGRALAPLRDEGVLIVGSGMSFHNMAAMRDPSLARYSTDFDAWLRQAAQAGADERAAMLARWEAAPNGRLSHPREEHLIPLMVAAGASGQPGTVDYAENMMGSSLSGYRFA